MPGTHEKSAKAKGTAAVSVVVPDVVTGTTGTSVFPEFVAGGAVFVAVSSAKAKFDIRTTKIKDAHTRSEFGFI